MKRERKRKSLFRTILERMVIPLIAISLVWLLIPKWPWLLLVIVFGFVLLVLIAAVDYRKEGSHK
jgi:uncharacterized membrane protein YdbT with pleckstrin-like domain